MLPFLHTVEKAMKLNIFLKINEYKSISIVILTYYQYLYLSDNQSLKP